MAAYTSIPPSGYRPPTPEFGSIGGMAQSPYQMPEYSQLGNRPNNKDEEELRRIYEMYLPNANAGLRQIPALTSGATPEGYDQRISDIIGMDSTQSAIGEQQRSLSQALASQGMRRSGYGAKSAAQIPGQVAQSIEGQMTGRSQSLFGVGEGAIGQQNEALSAMLQASDNKKFASDQRSAQRRSQNTQMAGMAIGLLALSDERLKDNIEPAGYLGKIPLIKWTWNKIANSMGYHGEAKGVSAQRMLEIIPDAVVVGPHGYLMIDYSIIESVGGAA